MSQTHTRRILFATLLALGCAGCGHQANHQTADSAKTGHETHDGWWCDEHGVPEEVCTRCSPKLVAGFKAKGDWCTEHERPESQCFICNPDQEAEFAKLYEAKYGRKPPKPNEEHEHSHDDHDLKSHS